MKSIALIGMPGCGKTTIGKLLAEKLGVEFYDMDLYIESTAKMTIKELFEISEEHFRDRETEACEALSTLDSVVVSTGGGVVKRKNNIEFLRKNCTIVFVDRSVEDIISDINHESRPLLADNYRDRLLQLYDERFELYKESCDLIIKNESSLEEVVEQLVSRLDF